MDLGIQGKRALVTGGSKGIGFAIARRLALEGCEVVLVARSATELEAAAGKLHAESGSKVSVLSTDLADREAAARIAAAHPAIDILVNNAGAIPTGTVEQVDADTWRQAWDVKVYGTIDLCRHYLPRMRERRSGVILNIIGAAGEMFDPNYIAGGVGNAALVAFTKTLGSNSLEHGVRVLGINPGPVLTERLLASMRKRAAERLGDPERWREIAARMPSGRAAEVEEIAASAALLCSPLSAYTTGSILTIDGGISKRVSIA
jgi:NAD(P)-dependent dehydrogenase (short-subunit alcohol dehydrogenase family)